MSFTEPLADNRRPLIFGEVLFDEFEDGLAVMGGAPFNVAWHLQGFGLEPLLISRIGRDDLGRRVIEAMEAWGLDISGVQEDLEHPTGRVQVKLADGQPEFDILADQAYDHIDFAAARDATAEEDFALFYYGSLAARHSDSRQSLLGLRQRLACPSFVDINLRAPWWEMESINLLLNTARWVKLNERELELITQEDTSLRDYRREVAQRLRHHYGNSVVIITEGAKGAGYVAADESDFVRGRPVKNLVDAVGAGDGFSAVCILGLIMRWPVETIFPRAMEFAAEVCLRRGATFEEPPLYATCLERWGSN